MGRVLGERRHAALAALAVVALLLPEAGRAVEALDGRVQIHGYAETQLRALNEKFEQELDLAQWYNVLNLEFEVDVLPQGWGPLDYAAATVRLEGRYDAIYSQGFGLFQRIDTYGDGSRRLPKRLRDARDPDYALTTPATEGPALRIRDERPAPFAPRGERQGIPVHDDLFRQPGGDNVHGTPDDPGRYASQHVLGHRFALVDFRGPESLGTTRVLGPWLPRNAVVAVALNTDRANPFRGRIPPTALASAWDDAAGTGGDFDDPTAVRFFAGDPHLAGFSPAQIAGFQVDPLDPSSPLATALFASDTVITERSRGKCERAGVAACVVGASFPDPDGPGLFTVQALNQFPPAPLAGATDFASAGVDRFGNEVFAFGGDFSGVVPCVEPSDPNRAPQQRGELGATALVENESCLPGSFESETLGGVTRFGRRVTRPTNLRLIGGRGETPYRPAPDLAAAAGGNGSLLSAQGLYLPSAGLRNELRSGHLDSLRFDFDENERAFNRGASQQRTKELKEAYLDLETLESRLWMRLGLQNIVWGKTEIFRTTDHFNPQDLALSSLPTLEESRIALWSARFVYSLYDVGALEDVRLELALNFDHFEPADLGACGEPYAPDATCTLSYGLLSHSYTGAGIAGVDRPEAPWKEPSDLEIGGRIEWRWDRFSFALTDFYGFDDLPYADAIFFYDRAVDARSGRPVVAALPGQTLGRCALGGQVAPDPRHKAAPGDAGIAYSTASASHPYSVTTAQTPIALGPGPGGYDSLPDGRPLDGTTAVRGGIGRDPDCLRPGGAPGFANAFGLDPGAVVALTNALEFHAANQQLFAWSCLSTVGIASALEPGACAWNLFASSDLLRGSGQPIAEAFVTIFAGDPDGPTTQRNLFRVHDFQKSSLLSGGLIAVPVASLNRLFNDPRAPLDRNGNGAADVGAGCRDDDPATPCDLGGYDGFDTRTTRARFPDSVTLDSSLTNEQRALLGCGPFYGIRCDSSSRETRTLHFAQSGPFGGLDLLNLDASVLVQSWLGVEGTRPGQTALDNWPQPGTIGPLGPASALAGLRSVRTNTGFAGGPVCTRLDQTGALVKLPGCRGIESLSVVYSDPNGVPGDADDVPTGVQVSFESGYLPSIDGCLLGSVINRRGAPAVPVTAVGASAQLARELAHCNGATLRRAVPAQFTVGFDASLNPIKQDNTGQRAPDVPGCQPQGFGAQLTVRGAARRAFICGAQEVTLADLPLIHPTAGCIDSPTNPGAFPECFEWYERDLVEELFAGSAQLFQNELAAFSWNFLMFLAISSCDLRTPDLDGEDHRTAAGAATFARDPECFLASDPYRPGRCSLSTPQLCANVKTFLSAVGVTRNTLRAAGNERFGRRTFIWHSGGEAVLRYDRQNVLGLAMDFAEDVSKTSWGIEVTWTDGVLHADADEPLGLTETDVFNLTISVDRPTFIHFLNPNRTFLFNMQWFLSYLPEHRDGFVVNGPVNAVFTFALNTGYWQDRMIPQLLTVYDLRARAGGVVPSLEYRFTDNLSATLGVLYFFGRTQFTPMPLREISPVQNRAGQRAYYDGTDQGLSQIRKRDELFLKLRWAF